MKFQISRPFRWLALGILLAAGASLNAATLLKQNFETTNPWSAMAGYSTTGGGTVTATPGHTAAGTIDAYGTGSASSGLQLTVNSSTATGNWSAGVNSGVLSLLTANTRGTSFLTLAFSLSASSAYPVRVKIESYNSGSTRTGGLATLIFPAAADFYQRYALDLDKMTADGAGTFNPADPKVRISFEIDNTANGTGWPLAAAHVLKFDNISYATPKYYVKPASIGGNDGASGLDEATALATIQAAANKTLSGDNIIAIMDDGTVGAADFMSSNINGDMVNLSKPGTPDAWIVFKNYPGDMPVLTTAGWDAFRICNNTSGGSAAYVEIRGLTIRGHSYFDANGDRQINPAYQSFVGQTASQTNSNGIGVDRGFNTTNLPHNIRVADNIIEFCAGANGCSGDRQTFENNIIRYNCWWMKYAGSGISFAFAVDTETGANYRNLIQNNIIYGNECMIPWYGIPSRTNPYSDGNGIIIDSHTAGYTGRTLIQNNLVFNNGGSGIHVLKASNVDIVHNTVYMNSASTSQAYGQVFTQSVGSGAGQTVTDARVTNNIMFAGRNTTGISSYLYNETATSVATSVASTIFHKRNVYAGGDTTPPLVGANLSDNTDLGRSYNASSLFISPSIDPAVADFRLRAASIANNYGSVIGYRSSRDLALTSRLIAGTSETGAYETIATLAYSPISSPKSGSYTTPQSVTLISDTAGATIVYTTNGSIPAVDGAGLPTNGIIYSAAIPVSTTTTVKAIAWKSGLTTSPLATAIYDFTDLSAVPIYLALDVATGTYPGTQIIQPLTRTPGAFMRFTTNGTDPTPTTGTPQEYRGYSVIDFASVRYQAYKAGRANSVIATATVTVRAKIGSTDDGSSVTTIGANKVRFVRFQTVNPMSAANIYARIVGLTGGYRAAIYSDSANSPATRLATSNLVSNPVTGWTVFPLAARTTLARNGYYWLAIWSDNAAAGIYSTPTGGTVQEVASTFSSTWPSTVNTTTTDPDTAAVAGTVNYSIYAMNQPPNLAPVVSAGIDQTLVGTANLAGSVSDDGVPLAPGTVTQVWSKVSGPGTVTFGDPADATTTAGFSVTGTYVLRLTARDALLTSSDDVTIGVGTGSGPIDTPPPAGVVRARFSDGNGTAYPQQYAGVAGDGWTAGWIVSGTPDVAAVNTTPLNSAGNYLNVARVAGTNALEGVYRQWSNTTRPADQFSRLTFDVRLDSLAGVFNTASDNITITARPVPGATSGVESTFFIRTFGGPTGLLAAREWGIYSGDGISSGYDADRFVPSGLVCVPGVTYTFTIDLYGASAAGTTGGKAHGTYDVTVTDGTTTRAVLGSRFRSTAYSTGNYLSFSTQQSAATDNLTFSVDSIEMTGLTLPEPTTTVLTSNASPADSGQLVTFTATVSSAIGIPGGIVTFLNGIIPLGSGTLNGAGVATFATSALDPGLHSITAAYAASTNHTASASSPLAQSIRFPTTVTLASSDTPADPGAPVTFTATVDSDTGTPGGAVTFLDGVAVLGTGTLDGTGAATLTTSALAAGAHSITASYAVNATYSASVSEILDQVVLHTTSTALVSSANPATIGGSVTFTATVTSGVGIPSGTVTFLDGVTLIGTGNLNGSGVATLTISTLAVGAHSITAVYGGDPTHAGGVSSVLIETIVLEYEAWRTAKFSAAELENPAWSGPNADPDADGYENLVEYAFDTDPEKFTSSGMPLVSRNQDGILTMTFFRLRGDLIYQVEGGDNLGTWTALATNPGSLGAQVTVADVPPPDATLRFMRLRVVR